MKFPGPVLLLEDDEVDIMTVERAFLRIGASERLYSVRNGEEGLEFLRDGDRASHPLPGIILLDINMPIMGGIEFLREVKGDPDLRRIPVIVLTTSREDQDRFESYDLGAAGYIVKPVEFEDFVEVLGAIRRYWSLNEISNGRC
jgi:CheY-like chemotaxis protein